MKYERIPHDPMTVHALARFDDATLQHVYVHKDAKDKRNYEGKCTNPAKTHLI